MQLHSTGHHSAEIPDDTLHTASVVSDGSYVMTEESNRDAIEPTQFRSHFVDCMEMYADTHTVSQYFDAHHDWFRRCAHPMQVEPLGENGYELIIGKFGSFGYEVEPRIGLDLLPQDHGVYRIETIPIPGYATLGYDVDFRAAMELIETHSDERIDSKTARSLPNGTPLEKITRVQWDLDLTVTIQFPRFIHTLPKVLIQSTGDRLLRQIVRQVSNRLTRKVLEDFHTTHAVPIPKRSRKWLFQKSDSVLDTPDDA